MADLTVKQLARELGVSKQAIHKRINQLSPELAPKKDRGAYQLSPRTVDKIKETMNEAPTNNQPVNRKVVDIDREVDALKSMIKELTEEKKRLYDQLEKKDIQLGGLQKIVDQQQQLTLQLNHQNEKLQFQLEASYEDKKDEMPLGVPSDKRWWRFWNH